jgi:hypothetical protein
LPREVNFRERLRQGLARRKAGEGFSNGFLDPDFPGQYEPAPPPLRYRCPECGNVSDNELCGRCNNNQGIRI